jgi:Flp pilus assembly protein TadD
VGKFQDDTLWREAMKAFRASRLGVARRTCERLLERNARHANAIDMLGRIAIAQGFTDDAETHIRKLAELRPRSADPQVLLGEILGLAGRHDEAIKRYERALRLDPDNAKAVSGKAEALEQDGQRDKARAVLADYVGTGRETGEMAIVQCRLDLSAGDDAAVIELARRHLDAGGLEAPTRWHLGFLLGKALERSGRFDESFAAYAGANEAFSVPFDEHAWQENTDQIVEAYTPQRFASLPRAAHGSPLPVFIVGMPRSGSTLVETIIDAHPDAHGAGEFEAAHHLVESISLDIGSSLPYPACIEDFEQDDVDMLGCRYLDRLSAQAPGAKRIADKYLINYRHLGLLAVLFPQGRIIHCRRHPLDTGLSCFSLALMPHVHPWAADLESIGKVHLSYERLMRHWQDELAVPVLDVPYEGLVADPEPWTRRIVEFCGLPWDDRCLRFHERGRVVKTASYDQVTRPIYTSSVGRWKGFDRHLAPLKRVLAEGGWAEDALRAPSF